MAVHVHSLWLQNFIFTAMPLHLRGLASDPTATSSSFHTYQSLLGAPVVQEGLGVLLCHKQGSLLLSHLKEEAQGA